MRFPHAALLVATLSGVAFVACARTTCCPPQRSPAAAVAPPLDQQEGNALWTALLDGNRRWRDGRAVHPRQGAERRAALADTQSPRVVVLACADSRVAPEVLFDQGLGDLFVIRVAGNVATPEVEASLEYAVEHLGSRLIVVLGHERCGAVGAALAGGEAPGHLPVLLARIQPALAEAPVGASDRYDRAIAANARLTAEALAQNAIVAQHASAHPVAVRAAVYDLDTGAVSEVPLAQGR
jgi:carbonic anhydrase